MRDSIRLYEDLSEADLRVGLFAQCGVTREALRDLGNAFLLSHEQSIDAYLGRHSDLVEPGKLAIAADLCAKERPAEVTGKHPDHWYEYMWQFLSVDVKEPMDLKRNLIRILTLNYDRSLEFFLFTSTKNLLRIKDDEVALAAIQQLDISHLYGQLGDFHFRDTETARPYGQTFDAHQLRMAANGLKIMSDAREEDPAFAQAHEWFDWAEDICFLGFGFDATNCKRLGLAKVLRHRLKFGRQIPRIYATFLQRTRAEIDTAYARTCPPNVGWEPLQHMNLQALRETNLFQ